MESALFALFKASWVALCGFRVKDGFKWLWGAMAVWSLALAASMVGIPFLAAFFFLGSLFVPLIGFFLNREIFILQRKIDLAGLRNIYGEKAKVMKAVWLDNYRLNVFVRAAGVGIDEFKAKQGKLESAFGQSVEGISYSKNRKLVMIRLCKRRLPEKIVYSDILNKPLKPYSFDIGESLEGGLISRDIRTLPHLLIGGTTGGGKSNFFKTILLGLFKSSPHLQMYLIDLKRGVEVKEFTDLPNVRVAKNEREAVEVLMALKGEMESRYRFLEKQGYKNIDVGRDKKDLIVVGIDEGSVLFGKTSSKAKKELMLIARDLTDELAKLARASGIHLIIATQKPIKDSIDTKTLENLPARMSFKMSTHAGSNLMLGNSRAYALPDVKGRGIWKDGHKFIEVQTPFLSDDELEQEIASIKAKYEREEFKNFNPKMLQLSSESDADKRSFKENVKKGTSSY